MDGWMDGCFTSLSVPVCLVSLFSCSNASLLVSILQAGVFSVASCFTLKISLLCLSYVYYVCTYMCLSFSSINIITINNNVFLFFNECHGD